MIKRSLLFTVFLAGSQSLPATGQSPATAEPVRLERLASLGKLWGYAKFYHPALAFRTPFQWDSVALIAIDRVRAAKSHTDYRDALDSMLAFLDDPLTRVESGKRADAQVRDRKFGLRFTGDSILILTVGDYYALFGSNEQRGIAAAGDSLARAKGVVIDLRSPGDVDAFGAAALTGSFRQLDRLLTIDTLVTAADRRRVYYGYDSPSPFSSGQYRSGLMTENALRISPTARSRNIPIVFLLDERAKPLSSTLALQAAGRALLVYQGDFRRHTIGEFATIDVGEGLVARVRESEPVFTDGTTAVFSPDEIVAFSSGPVDSALERAIAMTRTFRSGVIRKQNLRVAAATQRDSAYGEMKFPSLEYRVLAAFRLWSVIEHFYPYKNLLDQPWDDALTKSLPPFERAQNAGDYGKAVASMATRIQDSHSYIAGQAYYEGVTGTGYPPVRVRVIEGKPVVTGFRDSSARKAGVAIGDVILSVDGVPARVKLDQTAQYISTSTPQSRLDRASLTFMNGAAGTDVALTVQKRNGATHRVVLKRRFEDVNTLYHREREGDVIRLLRGNIGYIDLDRLSFAMIDSALSRLKNTRGIIFDMRGYPYGTIWAIAPRLTDSLRIVTRLETPLVNHRSPEAPAVETVYQSVIPSPASQRYRGRVVMLMDERTVSQAEHTGLYLKAVARATFVGTPTGGVDGELSTVTLPGGLVVGFTGQAAMWPDGRHVQRAGLKPDVLVKPTLRGLREGRDEVLEKALSLFPRTVQ